jgi:hypothetical protein
VRLYRETLEEIRRVRILLQAYISQLNTPLASSNVAPFLPSSQMLSHIATLQGQMESMIQNNPVARFEMDWMADLSLPMGSDGTFMAESLSGTVQLPLDQEHDQHQSQVSLEDLGPLLSNLTAIPAAWPNGDTTGPMWPTPRLPTTELDYQSISRAWLEGLNNPDVRSSFL